jgi:ribosome-interacting GTPase 1
MSPVIHAELQIDDLPSLVAPAGGSDAVGGAICAAVRAVVLIVTVSQPKNN